ncbi:MAG: response regulator [Anaerolineales bacterium]|nr:response regulator [Anaerolineales bacterium]
MLERKAHVFLVVGDPTMSDFIAGQALEPLGYQVTILEEVSQAIVEVARRMPDLVLVDLNLSGLKAKDLLAALGAQGVNVPVIVLARRGEEAKIIETFRLGARDFLIWPAREAEIIMAVERVVKQVQEQQARQKLEAQLQHVNQELQQRERELATLFGIGKAIVSITSPRELLEKILEGSLAVSEADLGWLLVRESGSDSFVLMTSRNVPEGWLKKLSKPTDDGLTSLVAVSGETLSIHGEPLKRFRISSLGKSALVAPVKIKEEVIGLFVLVRRTDRPFAQATQRFLESVASITALSLVNAHLFHAVEEASEAARRCETTRREQLVEFKETIATTLRPSTYPLDLLLTGKMGKLSPEQVKALETVRQAVQSVLNQTAERTSSRTASP